MVQIPLVRPRLDLSPVACCILRAITDVPVGTESKKKAEWTEPSRNVKTDALNHLSLSLPRAWHHCGATFVSATSPVDPACPEGMARWRALCRHHCCLSSGVGASALACGREPRKDRVPSFPLPVAASQPRADFNLCTRLFWDRVAPVWLLSKPCMQDAKRALNPAPQGSLTQPHPGGGGPTLVTYLVQSVKRIIPQGHFTGNYLPLRGGTAKQPKSQFSQLGTGVRSARVSSTSGPSLTRTFLVPCQGQGHDAPGLHRAATFSLGP